MTETPESWPDTLFAFDTATRWFVSVTAGIAERADADAARAAARAADTAAAGPGGRGAHGAGGHGAHGAGVWGQVGLGEWSVRDLVGHTSRALSTIETYLDIAAEEDAVGVAAPIEVTSAAAYYERALAAGTPEVIAERGRQTAATLGDRPEVAVAALAARVLARLATLDGTEPADTPAGRIRISEYLPSRTVELTVHTSDLLQSQGVPAADQIVPEPAAAATLHVLADLAAQRGVAAPLLRAATGRAPLPAGFSVL